MTSHDLAPLLRDLVAEGRADPSRVQDLLVGRDIVPQAASSIHQRHPGARHLVVCDDNTLAAAGQAVLGALRALGAEAELRVLSPGPNETAVGCDEGRVRALETQLREEPGLNPISVGSGTLTDITKLASSNLERPFQAFATAASMNGYTSAIAAVLAQGVKRTVPTRQAEAVFADLDVIRGAPAHLNQAGFGDLLSKPFSTADWLLSHHVRGVPFHARPAQLLDAAYDALLDQAANVGAATAEATQILTETILLSGFTMALAGTSAPASGGEHLISHYWDMEQHCQHREVMALHGAQVGVATHLSALLFDRLLAMDASEMDVDGATTRRPADPARQDTLAAEHPGLSPAVVEEVREQLGQKQQRGEALLAELTSIRDRWPEIRAALAPLMVSSRRIGAALRAAGAPDRPSQLGIDPSRAVHTIRVCRQIRSRYVALDLMDDLGCLKAWASEAVTRAES